MSRLALRKMRPALLAIAIALTAGERTSPVSTQTETHTLHPDAQRFPEAALGLFLHWDVKIGRPISRGNGLGQQ